MDQFKIATPISNLFNSKDNIDLILNYSDKASENAKIENLSVMPQNSYPCSEVAWISSITLLFPEFLMNLMASIRWSGLSENSSFAWFALWR